MCGLYVVVCVAGCWRPSVHHRHVFSRMRRDFRAFLMFCVLIGPPVFKEKSERIIGRPASEHPADFLLAGGKKKLFHSKFRFKEKSERT